MVIQSSKAPSGAHFVPRLPAPILIKEGYSSAQQEQCETPFLLNNALLFNEVDFDEMTTFSCAEVPLDFDTLSHDESEGEAPLLGMDLPLDTLNTMSSVTTLDEMPLFYEENAID